MSFVPQCVWLQLRLIIPNECYDNGIFYAEQAPPAVVETWLFIILGTHEGIYLERRAKRSR